MFIFPPDFEHLDDEDIDAMALGFTIGLVSIIAAVISLITVRTWDFFQYTPEKELYDLRSNVCMHHLKECPEHVQERIKQIEGEIKNNTLQYYNLNK